MKVFLWADEKFTLKLDGEYHGVKSAAVIEDFSPCLIEAFPHSGKLPISFIMDYRPLSHKNVDFYHLNDHIALKLKFQNIYDVGFKLLLQERVKSHGALVTIFTDGLTKIVVETPTHVESVQAPPHIKNYSIETKDSLIIIKSEGCPYLLTVFETTPHLCLKFANFVSEHTINPIFRTKTRIFDIERSTVLCEWNFESINKRPKIIERTCELPYYPTMPERIIKRIFFESLIAFSFKKQLTDYI